MAYRNIFVANTAKLTTKNEQLIVDNGETFSFPIEDVQCVLVEDCRSTLSVALISKFAEAGVTLLICNEKHMPSAALQPIHGYSRQRRQLTMQTDATLPLKKRIWQQIVVAKIQNQARCLELCGKSGAEQLYALAKQVQSGDSANVEGRAAAYYFKKLFGDAFRRSAESPLNDALNYGYALVRAVICRTLCLYGFEPALGVHHCNELNAFNLADDLIEPFRPLIDLVVQKTMFDYTVFETRDRAELLKALNATVQVQKKKQSLVFAVELAVQSYASCLKEKKADLLLPILTELQYRDYA